MTAPERTVDAMARELSERRTHERRWTAMLANDREHADERLADLPAIPRTFPQLSLTTVA